jgi:hypothetical protein
LPSSIVSSTVGLGEVLTEQGLVSGEEGNTGRKASVGPVARRTARPAILHLLVPQRSAIRAKPANSNIRQVGIYSLRRTINDYSSR